MFLKLFLTFLEIGAVSFGGGYGMISLIREKVLLNGWLSEAEFLSFIAVSESTPGPLAVNMATFIGASQGGVATLTSSTATSSPARTRLSAPSGCCPPMSTCARSWTAHCPPRPKPRPLPQS